MENKVAESNEIELVAVASGGANGGMAGAGGCCAELPSLRMSSQEASDLASMFKAISHPVRLQIVDLLSRYGGQVCVCDIEGHFNLSQPTISHHLKILRQAELVESDQRGIWVYYHIQPEAVAKLRMLLGELTPETV